MHTLVAPNAWGDTQDSAWGNTEDIAHEGATTLGPAKVGGFFAFGFVFPHPCYTEHANVRTKTV